MSGGYPRLPLHLWVGHDTLIIWWGWRLFRWHTKRWDYPLSCVIERSIFIGPIEIRRMRDTNPKKENPDHA